MDTFFLLRLDSWIWIKIFLIWLNDSGRSLGSSFQHISITFNSFWAHQKRVNWKFSFKGQLVLTRVLSRFTSCGHSVYIKSFYITSHSNSFMQIFSASMGPKYGLKIPPVLDLTLSIFERGVSSWFKVKNGPLRYITSCWKRINSLFL